MAKKKKTTPPKNKPASRKKKVAKKTLEDKSAGVDPAPVVDAVANAFEKKTDTVSSEKDKNASSGPRFTQTKSDKTKTPGKTKPVKKPPPKTWREPGECPQCQSKESDEVSRDGPLKKHEVGTKLGMKFEYITYERHKCKKCGHIRQEKEFSISGWDARFI